MGILRVILVFMAFWPCLLSAEEKQPVAAPETSTEEISGWVKELDSDLFDTRERAQKRLIEVGPPALEIVSQLAQNGSLESSTRAVNILLAWSETEDADLVVAALEQLASMENRPKEATLAKQMLAEVRENVALEKIVKLGGSFQLGAQVNDVLRMRPDRQVQIVVGAEWKGGLEGLELLAEVPHAVIVCYHSPPMGDEALPILERLPQLKRVELYGTKMTPAAVEKLGGKIAATIDVRSGAFLGVQGDTFANKATVKKVVAGGAADRAGIKEDDVISKLNGEEVKDFVTLTGMIAQHQPGDSVTFTILRPRPNNLPETLEVKVTFAQWGIEGAGSVSPANENLIHNTIPNSKAEKFRLDRR